MKHLIVLDLNGVLVDRYHNSTGEYIDSDFTSPNGYFVYVRPHTKEFLQFVFEHFHVGVWSLLDEKHTTHILNKILTDEQIKNLKFILTQYQCIREEHSDHKTPVFLKDLSILWASYEYYAHKTVLIDTFASNSKLNPPYVCIHPTTYIYTNQKDDTLLRLTRYLEKLVATENIPQFMQHHPYEHFDQSFVSRIFGALYAKTSENISKLVR